MFVSVAKLAPRGQLSRRTVVVASRAKPTAGKAGFSDKIPAFSGPSAAPRRTAEESQLAVFSCFRVFVIETVSSLATLSAFIFHPQFFTRCAFFGLPPSSSDEKSAGTGGPFHFPFFHSISVRSFKRCGLGTLIGVDPECCQRPAIETRRTRRPQRVKLFASPCPPRPRWQKLSFVLLASLVSWRLNCLAAGTARFFCLFCSRTTFRRESTFR
jgi:hypothetical protein